MDHPGDVELQGERFEGNDKPQLAACGTDVRLAWKRHRSPNLSAGRLATTAMALAGDHD